MAETLYSRRNFILGAAVAAASVASASLLSACGNKNAGGSYQNLCTALQTESDQKAFYSAAAEAANSEGYEQVARLFNAAAEAEQIHIDRIYTFASTMNPKCEIPSAESPSVGASAANLMKAIEGETAQVGSTYPEYISIASDEGYAEVSALLQRTCKAEGFHGQLFYDCFNNLENLDGAVYHLCPICGYIRKGGGDATCPICNTSASAFIAF